MWALGDYSAVAAEVVHSLGPALVEASAVAPGQRKQAQIDTFATAEAFRDYFKSNYGPTIAIYRNIAADPEKIAALASVFH
jgi:hypothetical protein